MLCAVDKKQQSRRKHTKKKEKTTTKSLSLSKKRKEQCIELAATQVRIKILDEVGGVGAAVSY